MYMETMSIWKESYALHSRALSTKYPFPISCLLVWTCVICTRHNWNHWTSLSSMFCHKCWIQYEARTMMNLIDIPFLKKCRTHTCVICIPGTRNIFFSFARVSALSLYDHHTLLNNSTQLTQRLESCYIREHSYAAAQKCMYHQYAISGASVRMTSTKSPDRWNYMRTTLLLREQDYKERATFFSAKIMSPSSPSVSF